MYGVFTGLIEEKGTLARRAARGPGARLAIRCALAAREPYAMGESIAVDGCCLSVVSILANGDGFEVDASAETLARTTLGDAREGRAVNLERAAKLGQRMGGHIVTGHVDGIGEIVERRALGEAIELAIAVPPSLARFVAEKGSVCVDGVSLTVNKVTVQAFEVAIIPHTRSVTSLDALQAGARVNLEVDILARYVARILDAGKPDGDGAASEDAAWLLRLQRSGYV